MSSSSSSRLCSSWSALHCVRSSEAELSEEGGEELMEEEEDGRERDEVVG